MAFLCSFSLSVSPPPTSCNRPETPLLSFLAPLKSSTPKLIKMVMTSNSRRDTIPARDVVIDFGKYKGRMLGTLPSSYLKWVSKNLRARDYQEWANRADEVLADPVYGDRIEWEHAQRILTGNYVSRIGGMRPHVNSYTPQPVSDLLDISRRFGWDNDDKESWGRVDFELLGTSKGGRIPRIKDKEKMGSRLHIFDDFDGSRRWSSSSSLIESNGGNDKVRSGVQSRRELRRERLRMRQAEDGDGVVHPQHHGSVTRPSSLTPSPEAERRNPFPGRQSILRKLGTVIDPN